MERLAELFEEENARAVDLFSRTFEPILMALIGLVFGLHPQLAPQGRKPGQRCGIAILHPGDAKAATGHTGQRQRIEKGSNRRSNRHSLSL